MKSNRLRALFVILGSISATVLFFTNAFDSSLESNFGKGLSPWTDEEAKALHQKLVVKVHPNQRALERANQERIRHGQTPLSLPQHDQELETVYSDTGSATATDTTGTTTILTAYPAQVDNSSLIAFPNIGNQGAQGSCVAWATTYYMMSHEFCLVIGCNNKISNANNYSPRWTYNMINGGIDSGSSFSTAFSLISKHGAATLGKLPYTTSDYKGWDLNPDDWKSAISTRLNTVATSSINSDSVFGNIKQLLANGHVLVIGTYISSWQFRTVQDRPDTIEVEPFVGQQIVTYLNGTSGGHAMTVVGYDDSIWTDINGNGLVEVAELGAFKIANSWGASWKNGGYAWASYDAFRSASTVPNFAPSPRYQLTQSGAAYLATYSPRTLKALAKVTLSHLSRYDISLQFGTSSTSTQTPQSYWSSSAMNRSGGAFAFNGTTTETEGTFYFDLSDITPNALDQTIFYLIPNDATSGNPLTVKSFEIIDPLSGNTLYAAYNVPSVLDMSSGKFMAGNYTPDLSAPTAPGNLTSTIAISRKGKNSVTTLKLSWSASTDNVGVTSYKIYRNGQLYGTATTLSFSDSKTSTGTTYTYEVSAVDEAGNESLKSNSTSVTR